MESLAIFRCPFCLREHKANSKTRRFVNGTDLLVCGASACRAANRAALKARQARRNRRPGGGDYYRPSAASPARFADGRVVRKEIFDPEDDNHPDVG